MLLAYTRPQSISAAILSSLVHADAGRHTSGLERVVSGILETCSAQTQPHLRLLGAMVPSLPCEVPAQDAPGACVNSPGTLSVLWAVIVKI